MLMPHSRQWVHVNKILRRTVAFAAQGLFLMKHPLPPGTGRRPASCRGDLGRRRRSSQFRQQFTFAESPATRELEWDLHHKLPDPMMLKFWIR